MKLSYKPITIFVFVSAFAYGKESELLGKDLDGDGVRDDIERIIEKIYPESKDNREVLRYTAKVYQSVIISTIKMNNQEIKMASNELAKLASCYIDYTELDGRKEVNRLKGFIFNSKTRMNAYEKFNKSLNGSAQKVVDAEFYECRLPQN